MEMYVIIFIRWLRHLEKSWVLMHTCILNFKADIQNRPESDDASLKDNYPNWIHLSSKWDPVLFFKNSIELL